MKTDKTPETYDEFGAWLNRWAGMDVDDERTEYQIGYGDACLEILRVFDKINPSWMEASDAYRKECKSEYAQHSD